MTVSCPREVAYEMLSTVSPGRASPSCAAVVRCQVTPLREVQITACVALSPTAPAPAARNPGYAVGGGQGPGQAIRAGPDSLRAYREPATGTSGQPGGCIPQWGLPATGRADRGEVPGLTAVDRHEELLASRVVASQPSRRDDRAVGG